MVILHVRDKYYETFENLTFSIIFLYELLLLLSIWYPLTKHSFQPSIVFKLSSSHAFYLFLY